MTKTPTKQELRAETRDWLKRGAIPAAAAKARRDMARTVPNLADWHEAFAAEWERIAAKFPEKVKVAYEGKRDYAIQCLANQQPGSELARYWQDEAAKWDRAISELNITE